MKNVQSFHVIRFLTKIKFVLRYVLLYVAKCKTMLPSLTEQFALNNYSKIRVQTEFLLKIKNINNYELQNYNSLFETFC